MRTLVWTLLILAGAVGLALFMRFNDGNVALLWPPYRIDLSINLAVLLLAAVFVVLHLVLVGLAKALELPRRVRDYRESRLRAGASAAFRDAVLALFEGRFGRAERLAQAATAEPSFAAPAALVAARAAHRLRAPERRDRWVERAAGEEGIGHAHLMTRAEFGADDRDDARVLESIETMQRSGARHIHALRLQARALEQSGQWAPLLETVRQLERRDALHPAAIRGLKARAYRGLFGARNLDADRARRLWAAATAAERSIDEVAEAAAEAFASLGLDEAARSILEPRLETALSGRLVQRYARLSRLPARDRLARLEAWRQRHGDDAALLLALGQLCAEESLWGKAEEYLREALRREPSPAAHLALADLLERTGRPTEATRLWQAGLRSAVSGGAAPRVPGPSQPSVVPAGAAGAPDPAVAPQQPG